MPSLEGSGTKGGYCYGALHLVTHTHSHLCDHQPLYFKFTQVHTIAVLSSHLTTTAAQLVPIDLSHIQ